MAPPNNDFASSDAADEQKIPSSLSNDTDSAAGPDPPVPDIDSLRKEAVEFGKPHRIAHFERESRIETLEENEQLRQRGDANEREKHQFRNELEDLKQSIRALRDESQSKQTQLSEDMAKLKDECRDEKQRLHGRLDATERENKGLRTEIGSLKESIKDLRDNSPLATMQDAQAQLSKDLADLRKEYDDESKLSRDRQTQIWQHVDKNRKEYVTDKEQLIQRVKVLEPENNEFKSEIRNETSIQDLPDNSRFKTMDANHKALVDTQVALSVSHKVLNERQDTVDKGQSQISAEWNNHRKKCDARAQQQKEANESTRSIVNNLHIATDNMALVLSSPIPAKRKDDGDHEGQDGRKHASTS